MSNSSTNALAESVSVVVLTKNEEAGLSHTLDQLTAFRDVVVVDSASTDKTCQIAEDHGARVVQFSWDGGYPKKKQWALEHAGTTTPWVLLLDADEYPTNELIQELSSLFAAGQDSGFDGYDLTLRYRFAGRYLRFGHRVTKRSLLRPDRARFPEVGDLHLPGIREVEGHYQPEVTGHIGRLHGRLVHDDRDPVGSWFDRHNKYADWEAHLRNDRELNLHISTKRSRLGRIFALLPFKPAAFFLYSYVARLGFLDGRAGLDYALGLTFYYWQIGVRAREMRADHKE